MLGGRYKPQVVLRPITERTEELNNNPFVLRRKREKKGYIFYSYMEEEEVWPIMFPMNERLKYAEEFQTVEAAEAQINDFEEKYRDDYDIIIMKEASADYYGTAPQET